MALSKDKKAELIAEVSELLASSKLTVVAKYQGTTVKSLQELRKLAGESDTHVKVVKNRLFKKVLAASDKFKDVDTSMLEGQLMYAFNTTDELAPAQNLANFAKSAPQIELIAGLTSDGQLLGAADIKALAALPGKEQLRGQLVGTIAAPISGFVNVLAGNVRGVLGVLNARAESIGN